MRRVLLIVVWIAVFSWLIDRSIAEAHGVTIWTRLADCETGDGDGRWPYRVVWDYNGRSGYDGGYQFHPTTWRDNKPRWFPRYAYQASPTQQTYVAQKLVALYGWRSQFPACARKLGVG